MNWQKCLLFLFFTKTPHKLMKPKMENELHMKGGLTGAWRRISFTGSEKLKPLFMSEGFGLLT